jgi:ABC-type oligopeptide transport system substrate-binding subunit
MPKIIRILYDAAPLSKDLAGTNDYGSLVIYSPMAAPLMRYDWKGGVTLSPVCLSYYAESSGMLHRFTLVPGWKRADGSPITAKDYVAAIHQVLKTDSQATILLRHLCNYNKFRAGLTAINNIGVYTEGSDHMTLVIETSQPDYLIPKILASCRFSPLATIDRPERTSGPFYLNEQRKGCYHYTRNQGYPYQTTIQEVSLQFEWCKAPEDNVKNYLLGNSDITCNTAFPYEKVLDYQGQADFKAHPNQLIMGLVFIQTSKDSQKARKLRRALQRLIDRRKIARQFNWALTPASDFRPNYTPPFAYANDPLYNPEAGCAILRKIKAKGQNKTIHLTCGFDSFYPNKKVVEAIRLQLKKYQINLIPIEDSFESSLHHKYQLKLMILFPEIHDDLGLYSIFPFCTPLLLESEQKKSYLSVLDAYTASDSKAERQWHLTQLDYMTNQGAYIVPLFKLNDIYLNAPYIKGICFNPLPDYSKVRIEE